MRVEHALNDSSAYKQQGINSADQEKAAQKPATEEIVKQQNKDVVDVNNVNKKNEYVTYFVDKSQNSESSISVTEQMKEDQKEAQKKSEESGKKAPSDERTFKELSEKMKEENSVQNDKKESAESKKKDEDAIKQNEINIQSQQKIIDSMLVKPKGSKLSIIA